METFHIISETKITIFGYEITLVKKIFYVDHACDLIWLIPYKEVIITSIFLILEEIFHYNFGCHYKSI